MRKSVLACAVVGLGLPVLLGASPASAAVSPQSSGGGCSGNTAAGGGWSFSACISARDTVVLPNGYLGSEGSRGSSCTIWVDLIKNGSVSSHRANPCNIDNGEMLFGVNTAGSGTYFTAIYAEVNGSYTSEVISPIEHN